MQTLYYVSSSSSLTLLPDFYTSDPSTAVSWSIDTLTVSSSLGEIVAFSSSVAVASFPIASTNLFFNKPPLVTIPEIQTIADFYVPINITFDVLSEQTTTANKFTITTGSTTVVSQSEYSLNGGATAVLGKEYTATVSGSGEFYDLTLVVTNLSTLVSSSISSSSAPISTSFSASAPTDLFSIVATTNILPYIKTTFSSSNSIPVSPTSSITAWNTYLGISGSYVTSSGGVFYVVGGDLRTTTSSIIITGSGLSAYFGYETNIITNYTLTNNKLGSFPNVVTASSTIYFNVDSNRISGSLPNIFTTQSLNLATFIASNNRLSGSIPALSGSSNLSYFDVNTNYITGTLDLSRCYNLTYFDASNNQLSGSFTLLDDGTSAFNTSHLYVSSSGRIGIGTATPTIGVLDITDLVTAQKNIEDKQEEYFQNLFKQLEAMDTKLKEMDGLTNRLSSIEDKIEKYKPKTPQEKLELRSLDSGPFNQKLSQFFDDKEDDMEKSGKNEYILTQDDVEDYSPVEIKKTFRNFGDEGKPTSFQQLR